MLKKFRALIRHLDTKATLKGVKYVLEKVIWHLIFKAFEN